MSHSSSFYWAMRLLPAHRRRPIMALYGYCRTLDDIADGPLDETEKLVRLDKIATTLEQSETWKILSPLGVPLTELQAILDGVRSDVALPPFAPPLLDLQVYCRRVAGAVGVCIVHILGRPQAVTLAIILGEALQLTNILRDIGEDAARGRLYIPHEFFNPTPPSFTVTPTAFGNTAELAKTRFLQAHQEIKRIGRQGLWPAQAMAAIYEIQLDRLMPYGAQGMATASVRLGSFHALMITLRTMVMG